MQNQQNSPKFHFTQNTRGQHIIRDAAGNEITIDATQLTMTDIRELLNGFGNIMQAISTYTWNQEFVRKDQ